MTQTFGERFTQILNAKFLTLDQKKDMFFRNQQQEAAGKKVFKKKGFMREAPHILQT